MNITKYIVGFSFLLLVFNACRKDSDVTVWDEVSEVYIDGFITNELGLPMNEVSVNAQGKMVETDENGYFRIQKVEGFNNRVYVKATKAGYFLGSRVVNDYASNQLHVRIKMIPKIFSYKFNANEAATVIADDKIKLSFPANSIASANGELYSGEVLAAVENIDPTTISGQSEMPGDLIGIDQNNEEKVIASFGMIAVELRAPDGSPLNIAEGKKVTMEIEVPSTLRENAPQFIPLWFFDEEKGVWVEEGEAELKGNYYEGEVSHFSFWNCDYPYELIVLKGTLKIRGIPSSSIIKLTLLSNNTSRLAIPDKFGLFVGKVPAGEMFKMEVINFCDEVVLERTIGPFEQDSDLGVLNASSGTYSLTDIDITVVDCDGSPVKNAFIQVDGSLAEYSTDNQGKVVVSNVSCSLNSINISAFDFNLNKRSQELNLLPNMAHKVELKICDSPLNLEEYVHIKYSNGDEFAYINNLSDESLDSAFVDYQFISYQNNFKSGGWLYHTGERKVGIDISVDLYSGNHMLGDDTQIVYEDNGEVSNGEIRYNSIAVVDGEYTSGTFEVRTIDKRRKEISGSTILEQNLTATGSFKIKYED